MFVLFSCVWAFVLCAHVGVFCERSIFWESVPAGLCRGPGPALPRGCPVGREEDACGSGPVWARLVGKALRRSQETWSAVVVPLLSWILQACPRPSLSLSSVTLEWEVLIFDPQESVQFRDLHLYHPDASQTHTRLVPKPQAEGPAPSSLCGSTSQRGLESPADASPARSPESCPPEQSSAPPSALHPGAGLARCSW